MGTMEVLQNVRLGGRQYCCINVEISSTEIPYQSRYHSSSLKTATGFYRQEMSVTKCEEMHGRKKLTRFYARSELTRRNNITKVFQGERK